MPRDDLSIDFVHKMAPSVEAQDPGLILDDWVHRTSNLHEEIRFLQDEIHDKDRAYHECVKAAEESDAKIQRWIRANTSAQPNPREDFLRNIIRTNYDKAELLAYEKMTLSTKLTQVFDKHLRHLDGQVKVLYDRQEPGFSNPDETPSVLRPSAANHSIPSTTKYAIAASSPLGGFPNNATASARLANPQIRTTQVQAHGSVSAPVSPAATIILNRKDRESSAGPGSGVPKRGPRINTNVGTAPSASSGLARHSSIGPGTPKAGTPAGSRAGSVQPRATTKSSSGVRKSTPSSSSTGRKKPPNAKSGLNRVKQVGRSKGSPTSTADSELSDAESAPSSRAGSRAGSGTPAPSAATSHLPHKRPHKHSGGGGGGDDDDMADSDIDGSGSGEEDPDEEGKKYCLCQHVSYGDMVACDNPNCPFEWFHWNCVGLKSEPEGRWFCPECREQRKKGK